jgi:hypothetical protein
VLHGPGQGVVGDLFPALLGGQQVGVAGVLLDLGQGVGLVVLGVGPLDAGGWRWSSPPEMNSSGARDPVLVEDLRAVAGAAVLPLRRRAAGEPAAAKSRTPGRHETLLPAIRSSAPGFSMARLALLS